MNQPIITVKNISKKYNITHQKGGYIAMRDVMANIAKKPLSFLKRKVNAIAGKTTKEDFWALKDIDFEVFKGEAIGIIGANGAGKSTLLKILTGITPPTTGEIKMHGKVASLLEVGTGFHQELTGRENIFLNGAILGMTKEEIAEKFDAIVEFSGVKKFIDTPVKRYSSGMMVRLGFSVAAHMEPDILLVDEVLAVGDADFQKKCLGKMDEVTGQEGRTILFVSHNLTAIQNLCKRCILIEEGKIKMIGKTEDVIDKYLNINKNLTNISLKNRTDRTGRGNIEFTDIKILGENEKENLFIGEDIKFILKIKNTYAHNKKIRLSLSIRSIENNTGLISCDSLINNEDYLIRANSEQDFTCILYSPQLNCGEYQINIAIFLQNQAEDWIVSAQRIEIKPKNSIKHSNKMFQMFSHFKWETNNLIKK